jgi:hypothetical protein
VAKSAHLSATYRLRQKQPQVTTAAAVLRIGRYSVSGQFFGQVAQSLPALRVVSIEDEETGSASLVKKICAEGDLTSQVIKQVAHVQWFVDADVAAVVKLPGVQVPTLDEPLGQHHGWAREFFVWK